jgi:hypothetical protein
MVEAYNMRASNQGLPSSFMTAHVVDLLDPSVPAPAELQSEEFFNFDLAVVGMAYHHFEDTALATARLVERLTPGKGVLLIVDFVPDGRGHGHSHAHGHGHGHSHGHHGQEHGHGHDHGDKHDAEGEASAIADSNIKIGLVSGVEIPEKVVAHDGFKEAGIRKEWEAAGLVDVDYIILGKGVSIGEDGKAFERKAFMAKGRRASKEDAVKGEVDSQRL